MKIYLIKILLLIAIVYGSSSFAVTEIPDGIAVATQSSRKEADIKVNAVKLDINALVKSEKFEEAYTLYGEINHIYSSLGDAKYVMDQRDLLLAEKNSFFGKWAKYLEDRTINSYERKQYPKALLYGNRFLQVNSLISISSLKLSESNVKNIINRINTDNENQKFKEETSINEAAPEYQYTVKDMEELFAKTNDYMAQKDYEKAKECLEKILVIDKYNYKAMSMLNTIYTKVWDAAKAKAKAERIKSMAQVEWENNEKVGAASSESNVLSVAEEEKNEKSKIEEKLDTLIVSKVDFDRATINSVVGYLSRESKILDNEDEHKGVNIVLRLSNPSVVKPITLSLDEVPLGEVIKYVCLAAGLKYKIDDYGVVLHDGNENDMITKFIPIRSGLISSMMANLGVASLNISGTNLTSAASIGKQTITSAQLSGYFAQRGVPQAPGASISWDEKTGVLVVTNTPENINIMESLVKDIDIETPLVLIEAKFIEITETELEELSFKWKVSMSGTQFNINKFLNPSSGTYEYGNDPLMNYYIPSGGSDPSGALIINDLSYETSNGLGGTTKLDFWAYALDQSQTAEVLSSPKVTTKSGSKALVKMVNQDYYPTTWTAPSLTLTTNGITGNFGSPTFAGPTDLGMILEVTPTVSPDNHTILLDLKPKVDAFAGWQDYSYNISVDTGNGVTTNYNIPLKMANISRRNMDTSVKVYDGETVVLGGVITDNATYVDDIMPVIGELPLIGRLFSSKYKNVVKKNLLIFVTARLVTPDGKMINKTENNGIFDLKR